MIQNIDLTNEIKDWRDAICGEEVRAANIAAFEKIQGSVNDAIQEVDAVAVNAQRAAEDSGTALSLVNQTLNEAITAKNTAVEKAEESAANADEAKAAAERAAFYADFSVPEFRVDFMDGDLIYTDATYVIFSINEASGDLEYEYAA